MQTKPKIALRDVIESDLPRFFEHQADPQSCQMAAMQSRDQAAFDAHWKKILADPSVLIRSIVADDVVVGNVLSFVRKPPADDAHAKPAVIPEVGYWIGREYWGRGLASAALAAFVDTLEMRPLHATAAQHNIASIAILKRNGFVWVKDVVEDDGVVIALFELR